jgi:hypothetical protein
VRVRHEEKLPVVQGCDHSAESSGVLDRFNVKIGPTVVDVPEQETCEEAGITIGSSREAKRFPLG